MAGRYELAEVIGRGGMGTVYRAVDQILRRSVAVKLLPEPLAGDDPTSVTRFEREARAAAALNHPAVVSVYDTGTDGETRFIVMELVAGRSLEAVLRDDGPLPPEQAASIAAQVAGALGAAHRAGIVHRDIKPANVMITSEGSVKVLDFGIARAEDSTTLTQNASVLGTAAYMAPEQALGHAADARSDIYSLGCVLYAMLTGHPPFRGDGAAAIIHQQVNRPPESPRSENALIAPGLDALVVQMLAKSPEARPQSAAALRDSLAAYSGVTLATAGAVGATAATARLDQTAATALMDRTPLAGAVASSTELSSRHRLIALGALGGVLLLILIILLASGGGSPRRTADSHKKTVTTPARAKTTATNTATTSSTQTPTTTQTTPPKPKPLTVAGTAGALTSLLTRDEQAGTIDQQAAQQISNGLGNVLNQYESGNAMNAAQQLQQLDQQVSQLEQQGHVTAAATPSLNRALQQFGSALSSAAATQTTTTAPSGGPPGGPPGHGGQPPGQAKKHGDGGGGD